MLTYHILRLGNISCTCSPVNKIILRHNYGRISVNELVIVSKTFTNLPFGGQMKPVVPFVCINLNQIQRHSKPGGFGGLHYSNICNVNPNGESARSDIWCILDLQSKPCICCA